MTVFVRFWGTRGSIPTPGHRTRTYGGNTSCVEVRFAEHVFICDGGTGLRELGLDLMRRFDGRVEAHLLFSHMHWDHIQGFPFFVPAYSPTSNLNVYEITRHDDRVRRLLFGQMSAEYFPVKFSDLNSTIAFSHLTEGATAIGGVCIRTLEQTHPGVSYAYSFERDGFKVVYATDNEIDLVLEAPKDVESRIDVPRRVPEALRGFCAGADLLVADGQYLDSEYPTKVGWGHARATTVTDLAVQAGVKQLAIYHHDPMHSDDIVEQKVDACRKRAAAQGSDVVIFGAREGLELKL